MIADTLQAFVHPPNWEYPVATSRLAAHKLTLDDTIRCGR
jgi:hypothetical protein